MDIEKILRGQVTAVDVLREQEAARKALQVGTEASQLAYRSMIGAMGNPYADQMDAIREAATRLATTGFAGTPIDLSEISGAAGLARRAMEAIYAPPERGSWPYSNPIGTSLAALFAPPEVPGFSEALARLTGPVSASSFHEIASALARVTGPQPELQFSASRLADLFTTEFSVSGRGAVRASLGDWRDPIVFRPNLELPATRLELYLDQGMSADIAAVSADDTELNEYVEAALLDIEDDGNVTAYRLLMHVEQALRQLIRLVLDDVFGPKWWSQQVPLDVREKCEQKLHDAVAAGADDAHPIDYADFTDYEKIICRTDNFKQAFQPILGRVGDVRESLQRLHPVRLICMHSRIVRGADLVLVQFEAPRILARVKPRIR